MNASMKPKPGLYWDQQGQVACADHCPGVGTDTWVWGRWRRMAPNALASMRARCETCGRAR
jgi:hypothetical protein